MILFSIYMHSTSICVICQVVNRGISRMRLHFGLLSERGEWPAVVAWYMPAQMRAIYLKEMAENPGGPAFQAPWRGIAILYAVHTTCVAQATSPGEVWRVVSGGTWGTRSKPRSGPSASGRKRSPGTAATGKLIQQGRFTCVRIANQS